MGKDKEIGLRQRSGIVLLTSGMSLVYEELDNSLETASSKRAYHRHFVQTLFRVAYEKPPHESNNKQHQNGMHLYSAFLVTNGHPKLFTILSHNHPFIHTFTHQQWCQPCKAPASSSGAVRVRCLANGHLDTPRWSQGLNQQPCGYQPTRSTTIYHFLQWFCDHTLL